MSGRSVVQVNDAIGVDVRVVEPEPGSGAGVQEQRLLATADHDRIDEEVQFVDESVGQQRADQRAATTDVDIAGAPGLQVADGIRVVGTKDGRVAPYRLRRPAASS